MTIMSKEKVFMTTEKLHKHIERWCASLSLQPQSNFNSFDSHNFNSLPSLCSQHQHQQQDQKQKH